MNYNYIKRQINSISDMIEDCENSSLTEDELYSAIRNCVKVLGKDLNFDESFFVWKDGYAIEDAITLIELLDYHSIETSDFENVKTSVLKKDIIFISHESNDAKYGNALRNFITGLGVKDEQLIFTSHPLHKIPLDANIYDYLRENINSNIFMIILWSDKYLDSPACLNEMGAAWVLQSDYTNVYVPDFSFNNPKYSKCAIDTSKMGTILNGDEHCKASMIELKDKIVKMFELDVDEKKTTYLIDKFVEDITK